MCSDNIVVGGVCNSEVLLLLLVKIVKSTVETLRMMNCLASLFQRSQLQQRRVLRGKNTKYWTERTSLHLSFVSNPGDSRSYCNKLNDFGCAVKMVLKSEHIWHPLEVIHIIILDLVSLFLLYM